MLRMQRFHFSLILAAILLVLAAAGCGSGASSAPSGGTSSGSSNGSGSGSSTGSGTGTGSGTSQQIVCNPQQFAVGVKVYYNGPIPSGSFTSANAFYTGTVQTIYANGSVDVTWDQLSSQVVTVDWHVLEPLAPCTPDVTNDRVIYTGKSGPSNPNFPDATQVYEGNIVAVYAGGFADVKWDHLTHDTVETFANFAIAVQH